MADSIQASPIVAHDTAEPSQPVKISIEPDPDAQQAPIDPNAPAERQELIPPGDWHTSPLFYEIANFLGVDAKDYEATADQISVITDYVTQKANSGKIEDIMHGIRELEDKLQPPPWGEKRVSHIYRPLRMASRYDAAKKAMGAFTKTGKWGE
jgi:hypothetical protein